MADAPGPSASPAVSPPLPTVPAGSKEPKQIPMKKPRTLVLCFDGTANQFDGDNTNVVKFYSLLKKDDSDEQLCYYQPGIGTYFQPGVVAPLFQWGAKILDEAVAWYLDAHVQGGYQFLMQNWRPSDKICIFGFSRGAYTARALGGMLHKIGLLPKDNPEQIPLAYKLYTKTDKTNLEIAKGFKETFCRTVEIEFMGVWDTVASVGVIMGHNLPFTTSNKTIKTFRHALSLDEHRVKFRPNLYHRPAPDSKSAELDPEHASPVLGSGESTTSGGTSEKSKLNLISKIKRLSSPSPRGRKKLGRFSKKREAQVPGEDNTSKQADADVESPPSLDTTSDDDVEGGTNVLEVWFAGCHSDVGGGAVTDDTIHSLSNITLRWMVRQVVLAQCGISFDSAALLRNNIPDSVFTGVGFVITPPLSTSKSRASPSPAHSRNTSRANNRHPPSPNPFSSPKSKTRQVEFAVDDESPDDQIDMTEPIHDQLQLDKFWWLLEIIPLNYSYQDGQGKWHKKFGFHFGKGRYIPDINPNFHITVKERMTDANLKYTPRAVWKKNTETYVD